MTTAKKTGIVAQCYTAHLTNGLNHEDAVAHISNGLGLSTDAVHYAIRPVLEAAALTQQLR